jgi:hypothetical protein
MDEEIKISLSFSGKNAEEHEIDLYDIAQALTGFHRSLALTTHLVLNDQIITQAPSLKGANIFALPSRKGSWELTAVIAIAASAIYKIGTAPRETPIGHLVYSVYDYIIKEALGFHVDYSKTLGKKYEEIRESEFDIPELPQHRLDALAEKCEKPPKDIHRPIYAQGTASKAQIYFLNETEKIQIGHDLDMHTFEYVSFTQTSQKLSTVVGRVSSYNSNTFKGRIYLTEEGRPIPFTLYDEAKSDYCASLVANSLHANTQRSLYSNEGFIFCKAYKNTSKTGLLKSINIINISDKPFI